MEPSLDVTTFLDPPGFNFPYGCNIAEVEVDEQTGKVDIHRYIAVNDVDTIGNPMVLDGQVQGAITFGLGETGALEYPSLLPKLQSVLANKAPTSENVSAAITQIELPLAPRQDLSASGDYRINLLKVLAKRAILRAAAPWGAIRAAGPIFQDPSKIEGTIIIRRNK
jgi:CO/xanthine dehydrogenase FAD-binding subunit